MYKKMHLDSIINREKHKRRYVQGKNERGPFYARKVNETYLS